MKKTFGELNCPPCGEPDGIGSDALLSCDRPDGTVSVDGSEKSGEDGSGDNGEADARRSAEAFLRQVDTLREERRKCKRLLALAKINAEPKKFLIFSEILLALLPLVFLFSFSFWNANFVFAIVFAMVCEVCIALFAFALVRKREARKKYAPLIAYYAKEIAELDALLARCEKTIADLTK